MFALEALRKVDRYGITSHGEQYTGWKAIGTGIALGPAAMTVEQSARVLADGAGLDPDAWALKIIDDPETRKAAYRQGAKALHPDQSEHDAAAFRLLNQAKKVLDEHAG